MDKNSFNYGKNIERLSTINSMRFIFQEIYVKLDGTKFFTLEIDYFFSFPCMSECSINGSQQANLSKHGIFQKLCMDLFFFGPNSVFCIYSKTHIHMLSVSWPLLCKFIVFYRSAFWVSLWDAPEMYLLIWHFWNFLGGKILRI